MGKTTGFLQYQRQAAPERPPLERVHDWQPIYGQLPLPTLRTQAARCMDCGIPFCHTGVIMNGMTSGCPLNNLIPEWNDLVYRGLWREAYERLAKTNNFPEFTGLVCPAPCEASCTLGLHDPPVTIKNIEYAIVDRAFNEGWVRQQDPQTPTGRHIAVVGSGPAGLACADQLTRVGHRVTIFERDDRPGGLLMYGIPNMKLDKAIVQRRIDLMAKQGVLFRTGVEVGFDVAVSELRQRFQAVVLCTGATRPRNLDVPGRPLSGIHYAVDFLRGNTKSLLDNGHHDGPTISARDKDVIVIGGGDTGTDCVATALRQRCRSLVQFEILPQPPHERSADNPWPQWPRVYSLDYGHKEAKSLNGADPRQFCVMTTEFVGDENGDLTAVQSRDASWQRGPDGRLSLREVEGSERLWPAQMVLLAMGFLGPEEALLKQLGVAQDERYNIRVPYGSYNTSAPGVFAAGDARRGQSLVVWAIHEGRGAAREVDRFLMGETNLP